MLEPVIFEGHNIPFFRFCHDAYRDACLQPFTTTCMMRDVISSIFKVDNAMARKRCRAAVTMELMLTCLCTQCAGCGQPMWVAYHTQRTITTLQGTCRLTLCVRRCRNQQYERYHRSYRPEEEGMWALPHGEFGLDVIALVGTLRYTSHRSVPEIHQTHSDERDRKSTR